MNWTEERVEILRRLWAEGLSASQIAAQLGSVSRNAVIGKVHRLKLSSRGRANTPPKRTKAVTPTVAPKPPAARPASATRAVPASVGATALQSEFAALPAVRDMERSQASVVVPISRQLQLIQLNDRTCKWPIGDPLADDFHFCGNDAAESGPYCRYHARVAFQPASERRRNR